jgi:hypothetical protein
MRSLRTCGGAAPHNRVAINYRSHFLGASLLSHHIQSYGYSLPCLLLLLFHCHALLPTTRMMLSSTMLARLKTTAARGMLPCLLFQVVAIRHSYSNGQGGRWFVCC